MSTYRDGAGGRFTIPVAPTGGVEAGKWYTIGSLTVLAVEAADAGDPFTVEAPGIYRYTGVPKASAAPAMTLGAKVYLIAADNDFTTAASGNTFAGYAGAAATAAATTFTLLKAPGI